jgi:hypothetical protein
MLPRPVPALSAAALAAALAGCFGNSSSEFPPGLEPLEDNSVPAVQSGSWSEALALETGEHPNYTWAHGRGYVLASPGAVWAAIKDPAVLVSDCSTDRHTVELLDEPAYELSFQLSYVVDELITIEWDEHWRYGTIEGIPAAPELAMVRYQKVYGSDLIQLIEGSVQLVAVDDPGVTEVQFIEHLAAAGGTQADMRTTMTHRFDAIVAAVRGDAHPACP